MYAFSLRLRKSLLHALSPLFRYAQHPPSAGGHRSPPPRGGKVAERQGRSLRMYAHPYGYELFTKKHLGKHKILSFRLHRQPIYATMKKTAQGEALCL